MGDDRLDGGADNDDLRGEGNDDFITGGPGNDLLDGGFGRDDLRGGTGNDYLTGGPGDDQLDGGEGVDTCRTAGLFDDTVTNCGVFGPG